jgi:hypothetical protein
MTKLMLFDSGNIEGKSWLKIEKTVNLKEFLFIFLLKCDFEYEAFDIDIVYGKDALFLIVRYKTKEQREFTNSLVMEYCEFKK